MLTLINNKTNKELVASIGKIWILSLFLALKYAKYCCLGQNPKNTFQSD